MSRRHRPAVPVVLTAVAATLLALGPPLPAAADGLTSRTYPGPSYSVDLGHPPTRGATQNKLWFHNGAWWALLLEPTGRTVRVFELMPDHSWRPTSAVVTSDAADVGDALLDGDGVHVVSRRSDSSLYYVRLLFDPAARDYRADAPVLVATRGSSPPATIAKDTTGRLWVAYASAARTVVTYSDNGGLTWARNIPLAIRELGQTAEAAALVAYDERIGLLWSDQTTGSFQFASHRDGDLPTAWAYETALAGPGQADDHISLKRVPGDPSDTLVAAVRTAPDAQAEPPGTPLNEVLVRTPDGRWTATPVSTNNDDLADPVVQVDTATRTLHVFASRQGGIVTKRASLDDIRFGTGIGDLFLLGQENETVAPAGTREPVDARSGLVVLASDATKVIYRHAELAISAPTPVVDPTDQTAPNEPRDLRARALSPGSVVLSWAEATDGDRWSPGRDGVPVSQYVLLRDGVEVATVNSTSARDEPRAGGDATSPASIEYQVQAVDAVGNRSSPAQIVVDLPAAETGTPTARLVGMGLLPLAAAAALAAVRRRWLRRG